MAKREKTLDEFIEELRDGIAIEKDDLDTMWIMQPQLFQRVAERLAVEISVRDEMKEHLKDIEAEIDGTIREEDNTRIERDGGKKMTETAIKNLVREDKGFKKLTAIYNAMKLNVDRLSALKETYQMRRYALQDLTSLHISGYSMASSSKPARERNAESVRREQRELRKSKREEE
jgi:hypothetical protein